MNIEIWWPKLSEESRDWLVEHNGEPVDAAVQADIASVAGDDVAATWQSDESVDWIEAVANGE